MSMWAKPKTYQTSSPQVGSGDPSETTQKGEMPDDTFGHDEEQKYRRAGRLSVFNLGNKYVKNTK
jgi:hypothetical protein